MRRMYELLVDDAISDSQISGVLMPALSRQLDEGGCVCTTLLVRFTQTRLERVDADVTHCSRGCPMEHASSTEEVANVTGGLN